MIKYYATYTLPDWSLSFIFNGDSSNLSNDKIEKIKSFLNRLPKGHFGETSKEKFFLHSNSIDGLQGNVVIVNYFEVAPN